MLVIRKDPGQPPELVEMENTLEALQQAVGGYIETVTFCVDAAIVCNEEGQLRGLPYNCNFMDISFVGPILIVGVDGECKYTNEYSSTGDVIGNVASNPNAIGYASLSAVDDTVKAVKVGGVECSEATIKDGSYEIQRPFVLVTKEGTALSAQAQAFFDFATSSAANDLIRAAGAVPVAE